MLVHICCSVDSHYFLERIQEEYPDETLVGYFYDPNIHPFAEYQLRYKDVAYSCKKLNIELLEGPYNLEAWLKKVSGMELLPEKGDRCTVCYDDRLENTVQKAVELGHDKFTSTLLISPKKSQDKLKIIGERLTEEYKCEFIFKDYRAGQGQVLQGIRVKEHSLYRQNYCGCLFGLSPQRESQDKLMDEMINPISNQILPESIESRLELYHRRDELEEKNIPYKVIKQKFLNYRLLSALVKVNKIAVPSYFLCYSISSRKKYSGRIEYERGDIAYLNKEETKIIPIEIFNDIAGTNYDNVKALMYGPPTFQAELNARNKITKNPYGLSPIIIVDKLSEDKYEIELNAKIYEDVKEDII